ncbi:MAG: bacillithiol biosynthesis cysteine-adding enzyme BshC [Pyrinomonadaceae bacterium]
MNSDSALAYKQKAFHLESFAFDEIPHQSKLFIDYQNNSESIKKYYPSKDRDLVELSQEVLENYKIDRDRLCDILRGEHLDLSASDATLNNIEKLRESDCVAVIAGQQAGLFSGSMYTIYKALSAIKLAADLNSRGINAVPLFWIASEDHDFDEANKTFVLDENGNIETISNVAGKVEDITPVAFIELGKHIDETIGRFVSNLRATEFTNETESLLREFYNSGETYSSAFAKLILKLFGELGLILVCPMNAGLRALCSPLFAEAIDGHQEITSALLERDRQLADENYHSQVFVDEDFFPFFYLDENNKRNALRFDKEHQVIRYFHGDKTFTKEELIDVARNSPEQLSPNVLMRSVVQDYLFPTICYYGGSAEIAYFAQNEVVYRSLRRPVTHFRHRSSFTIVDPKSDRNMKRYDLKFGDIFKGKEDILADVIDKFVASETAQTFAEVEELINGQLNRLDRELIKSEPTLSENLANRRRKILWHIGTLRNKFHRAETFKNEVLHNRIEYTLAALYPRDALQERTMNIAYFLNLFGPNFIGWLYQAIDLDEKNHQILVLD